MAAQSAPRVFRQRARVALYVSSFAPALPILSVRAVYIDVRVALLLAIACPITAAFAARFDRFLATESADEWQVVEATPADDGFAAYALGFLLPAAFVSLDDSASVAGLIVSFGLFGWLWTKTHLGHQNPALAYAGWHVRMVALTMPEDSVDPPRQRRVLLITKTCEIAESSTVHVAAADGPVWYERPKPQESDVLDR